MRMKLSIYLLFLIAILMYVVPAFWSLLAPNVARLEAFQSRTVCYISNSPWYVKNDAIKRGLKITSLDGFMRTLSYNLFDQASKSVYPHYATLVITKDLHQSNVDALELCLTTHQKSKTISPFTAFPILVNSYTFMFRSVACRQMNRGLRQL